MLLFGRAKYTSCLWTGFHRGWKVAEPLLTVPCWKGLWGVKVCEGRNLLIRFEGICSTILTRFGSSKIWIYIIFLLVQSMNIDSRNYEMGVIFLQQKILKVASLTHRFSSQPKTHGVQKSRLHRQVHSKNCGEHFKFLWLYLFSYPRKTCLSLKNTFLLDFASRYHRRRILARTRWLLRRFTDSPPSIMVLDAQLQHASLLKKVAESMKAWWNHTALQGCCHFILLRSIYSIHIHSI